MAGRNHEMAEMDGYDHPQRPSRGLAAAGQTLEICQRSITNSAAVAFKCRNARNGNSTTIGRVLQVYYVSREYRFGNARLE
ncbi:hypothetical protein ACLOJK_039543 [Asimina triloba]